MQGVIDLKMNIKIKMEKKIPKLILDRWATAIVPKDAIYLKDNVAGVNQDKLRHYEEEGYKGDEVLWIAPKDCIRFEFEGKDNTNHRIILECESVLKSLKIEYCITSHKGKSDYLNIFNIKGIPLGEDNQNAKLLFADMIMPSSAKDLLDRTNLGWTLSPVIGHEHWKPKYNGNKHIIIRGMNPLEQKNKYPQKLLKALERAKKYYELNKGKWIHSDNWVEEFLIEFCCNNHLPEGSRHFIIEKNLAAYLMNRKERELIKARYYKAQGRKHDSLRTWERAILNGKYEKVTPGELAKYIKNHSLPFNIPKPEPTVQTDHDKVVEKILNLFDNNKENIAENFYWVRPFFYDDETSLFWLWNRNNKSYERITDIGLMSRLKTTADNKQFQITESKFWTETIRALKLIGINHKPKPFKKEWIQFHDKIYNYKTKEVITATPDNFNANPIPWVIGKENDTPVIDKLFMEWVTEKHIISLKEAIGLAVLQDYPLHRIIYLFGSGCNGKGVFLRFMTRFLGIDNICSTSMERLLKNDFESSKLYKKLSCLIGETNFSNMAETSLLKGLSGQDLITAAFKGKNSFDYINYATLFVASNSLPISSDNTPGWYRRPYILDFPNQFNEGIDPLEQIPDIEYSNLCKQLLDILPKLIKRGLFTHDGNFNKRKDRYEQRSNSVIFYLNQKYEYNINSEVSFSEFYNDYETYCKETRNRLISKRQVGKILRENGYELEKKSIKVNDWQYKKMVVILNLIPNNIILGTESTESTVFPIKTPCRDKVKNGTMGTMGTKTFPKIHVCCKICGSTPCIGYTNVGKPICEGCAISKNIVEEVVQE